MFPTPSPIHRSLNAFRFTKKYFTSSPLKDLPNYEELVKTEPSLLRRPSYQPSHSNAAAFSKCPIPGVSHILLVASGKGGVGKSTVSVNLAVAASRLGLRVGLLDADVFGPSIPRLMGLSGHTAQINESNGIFIPKSNWGVKTMSIGYLINEADPIVWRGLMVMKALYTLVRKVHWGGLDLLVVDMPPGTGDTQLTICQMLPINGALLITTPSTLACKIAEKGAAMFKKVNVPVIGIVVNMSYIQCGNCHQISQVKQSKLFHDKIPILAELPLNLEISDWCDKGHPIAASSDQNLGVENESFHNLAEKICANLSIPITKTQNVP